MKRLLHLSRLLPASPVGSATSKHQPMRMAHAFCTSTIGPRCVIVRSSRLLTREQPVRSKAAARESRGLLSEAARHAVAGVAQSTSCRHARHQVVMTTCALKSTGEVTLAVLYVALVLWRCLRRFVCLQSSTALAPDMKKTKVLFVCLGKQYQGP